MSELQTRSMNLLKQRGYLVGSLERRKTFPAKGRQRCAACGQVPLISIASDLWNVFDLIAIKPKIDSNYLDTTFVQVTSATNHADRKSTRLNSSHLGISYAVF